MGKSNTSVIEKDINLTSNIFSANEWLRYTRHIQLNGFGAAGQRKLKLAHIVIVGAGGLGCPAALYLAAAGVGHITIVDGDMIELTNLQRQIGFNLKHIGQSKALVLRGQLLKLNPEIKVEAVEQFLDTCNAIELIENADMVLDCTDNFSTRYLINDTCYQLNKPWVMASISEFSGQCSLFTPGTACFRCLFPETPQNAVDCNSAGVIGVLPGMLAMYQSSEAIKHLVGLATPLRNNLLVIDALEVKQRKIQLKKDENCQLCGNQKTDHKKLTNDYMFFCNNENIHPLEITVEQFNVQRDQENIQLVDVRGSDERKSFHIGGVHIPLDELEGKLATMDKRRRYIFYCQSGKRSLKAAQLLSDNGFVMVNSLQQGLLQWLKMTSSLCEN